MSLAKIGVVVSRNKPMIMTVAGVCGVVGAGVLACKATIKAEGIKIETDAQIEAIKESGYSDEKEYKKSLYKTYLAAGRQYAKTYGPAILLGGASIWSILYGHNLLNKKLLLAAGSYKALTMDYDNYRHRVQERFGEDIARSITHDMKTEEITFMDGKKEKTQTIEYVPEEMGSNPTSDRSVFFDEASIYWSEDPEENKRFLMQLEKDAQREYDKHGYLFLNWIYKKLDVPETYVGAHCGWIKGYGCDEIDFGIFDVYSAASRRFVNGLEPVILLNFNDIGYIADKI